MCLGDEEEGGRRPGGNWCWRVPHGASSDADAAPERDGGRETGVQVREWRTGQSASEDVPVFGCAKRAAPRINGHPPRRQTAVGREGENFCLGKRGVQRKLGGYLHGRGGQLLESKHRGIV